MFKFLTRLFDNKHVHCFCDKKHDFYDDKGQRIIVMACNKCGLEETHVLMGYQPKSLDKIPSPPNVGSSIQRPTGFVITENFSKPFSKPEMR